MSTTNRAPSRAIFVGNIPYELSEQQIIDIFKEVGPVLDFKYVFDRDTGKPKGYGFITFSDVETASSAVRNLNGFELSGRPLRVDYASEADSDFRPSSGPGGMPAPPPQLQQQQQQQHVHHHHPSSETAIATVIASSTHSQLIELMSQMKTLVQGNPDQARALLMANPQLSYALFQAMLVSNIVDHSLLQRILQSQQAPTMKQEVLPQGPPMGPGLRIQPHPPIPPQPIPLPVQQPMISPSTHQPAVAAPPPSQDLQEHQKQLLMQVLALTPEQINMLPRDQKQHILQLRSQLMAQQK